MIQTLSAQIVAFDKQIECMAEEKHPATRSLRQVTGVGALTALTYVLVLEDPARFRQSRSVGSYLGLAPRLDETGGAGRGPELSISKTGDALLRRLLVSSAHYILGPFGPDTDLRRWGLALAARGGKNAKKRTVVAVARKLAVLLHRLWSTGEAYEPLRNAKQPGEIPSPAPSAAEIKMEVAA
jgi:transposase